MVGTIMILKRIFTAITKASLYVFMLTSFFRFISLEPSLTVWSISFATLSVSYAAVTLCNLFDIIWHSIKRFWQGNE